MADGLADAVGLLALLAGGAGLARCDPGVLSANAAAATAATAAAATAGANQRECRCRRLSSYTGVLQPGDRHVLGEQRRELAVAFGA